MNEHATLDQTMTEADRIGFFGKLPTHGDFVSTGLSRNVQGALDNWLQGGLQAMQQELGEEWERRFRSMSAWRFIIERGLWGPATLAGVIVPSADRVGRSFPLVIAAQLHGFADHPRRLYLDATWFTASEAIAETIATRDFDIGHFTASLKRLRNPRPADADEGEVDSNHISPRGTLWWRIDREDRRAKGFRTDGAPQPAHFPKLLGDAAAVAPPPPDAPPVNIGVHKPVLRGEQHRVLNLTHSYASHPGTRLALNADSLLVSRSPSIFAVADGVGDDSGAAEAGRVVTNVLREVAPRETMEALVQEIKGKLGRAHGLLQSAHFSSEREPASASVVVLASSQDRFALFWAGDARCYLLRDGMMRCLTRDHAEVGLKRRLSRGVGIRGQLSPELSSDKLLSGDRFLLCSNPLARVLPERTIAEVLLSVSLDEVAAVLAQEGLIANCRENISAIVIDAQTDDR
ncbi:type VI secretion system-associated protein TagF [Neorhizobium alkalisoli]|uniref:type VI secretion system-associated protein TagF n=1 Tax=Neorhizobium alkalisoli TaxID=528178 RepID=UPI000CF90345|nr:type VI secretion system-associated protein TagF [Neorhizobium alkalisoli]